MFFVGYQLNITDGLNKEIQAKCCMDTTTLN